MAGKRQAAESIRPRIKLWLEAGQPGEERHVFCSGMSQILEAVQASGSIKQAAARVGLSYRHVWSRIKQVEESLGLQLIDAQVGGKDVRRSTLTSAGKSLLEGYLRLRQRILEASDACARELAGSLQLERVSAPRTARPERPRQIAKLRRDAPTSRKPR